MCLIKHMTSLKYEKVVYRKGKGVISKKVEACLADKDLSCWGGPDVTQFRVCIGIYTSWF